MDRLTPAEAVEVQAKAEETLAGQAVLGVYAHWVLAALLCTTTSVAAAHPVAACVAAAWIGIVGAFRLVVARSYRRTDVGRRSVWKRLFALGLVLSSAGWGIGGAAVVIVAGTHRDSWLVLMTLAGISAGGLVSLSADLSLLRAHIACMLLPILLAGASTAGSARDAIGFDLVVLSFAAFLLSQGAYTHRAFFESLTTSKLLERQAAELEAARLESVEASRMKSQFLANMSHEIRTPMTAVIGYADLLLDPFLTPSERVGHLQTIRRNGEHLMSLLNDILDISKIEAGKMTVEQIQASPSQVLTDVASLMRVAATSKNLIFEVRYLGPIPETIRTDPTRLKQIVTNFVGNAIKFTETGSIRVLVKCEEPLSDDPRLVIDVADTGIGMTEDEVQRLFRSFMQADASTTRRFGGTGLGLVISHHLSKMLGATVSVESLVGRGSVFRLSLPTGVLAGVPMIEGLMEAGVAEPPPVSVRRVPSLPPSCRVLLAEDGHDNQVLVTAFLVKAGATVKVVPNGQRAVEEAIAAVEAGKPYDVVLMDMQMPELDGYGATSKLRLLKYDRPIIALTAHAMAGDRERCEAAGCDDYLTKPIVRAQLVAVVARYTGRSHAAMTSTFEDDEDMKEIVYQFVRDLPDRSSAILRASQSDDVETLRRLAHQLGGAAGGYGFPRITEVAQELERTIATGGDDTTVKEQVEALAALCRRVRAA